MAAINVTDLSNAKLDVDHIAEVANSTLPTATDRLGNIKDTVKGAVDTLKAFNSRGAWVTATAYAVKDLVTNGGQWYVCVTAHTSSAAFATDSANWRVHQGVTSADLALSSASAGIGFIRAATGAVARTQQDKSSDIISAFDFMSAAMIADTKLATPVLDHTTALQAALTAAAGKPLELGPYNFRCTAGLNVTGSIVGKGANFKFVATTISKLFNHTTQGNISGITVDASGVTNCENGLYTDTDFPQTAINVYDNIHFNNISNTDNTKGCNAFLFVKGSSPANLNSKILVQNCTWDGVTATANGIIGDTGGSSCGILVSINGSGTDNHITVRNCIGKNVLPAEDSGGIQFFVADHTSPTALGTYLIENCTIYNSRKRGIKIQSQNTVVRDVTVYGQNTEVGFDSYAYNTLFDKCHYAAGGSTAFRTSGTNTRFERCDAETNTQQPTVRLEGGAVNPTLRDCIFSNSAVLASSANNLALVDNVAVATFDNVKLTGSGSTGCGFSVSGNCDIRFSGGSIAGVEDGVLLSFSTGTFRLLNNASISALSNGFKRTGATSQKVIASNSSVSAAIGFNMSGTGVSAIANLNNVTVNATSQGIIAADGSRIVSCTIISPNVTGNGIIAGNSVIRDNQITKFAVGISYTFTTTAEVANNVTIGSTLPYETTGFTAFVNHNNNSR